MTEPVEQLLVSKKADESALGHPASHEARVLTALIGCMMVAEDVFSDAVPVRRPQGSAEFRQRVAS